MAKSWEERSQIPSMHVSLAGEDGTAHQHTAEPILHYFPFPLFIQYILLLSAPLSIMGVQSSSGW